MRELTAARERARSSTAAVAVVIGLAVAGCAGSAPGARAVPASAVARLAGIATRAAKFNGDAAPRWVTAVLTTHAKALTSATPGDFIPGADGVRVFLITMRGHFVANGPGPPGAAAPTGRYLSLVVNAKTFRLLDLGLSRKPPPVSPASLGPITFLTGRRQ